QPFIVAALVLVMALHSLASVARLKAQYALATLEVVVYGAFIFSNTTSLSNPALNIAQGRVLQSIPRDITSVLDTLDVEAKGIVRYASC
ncbi:hypothetical protein OH77DRAFT_1376523, partial [Trametes cingulata]